VETLARPTVDRIFGPLAALVPLHARILALIRHAPATAEPSEKGEPKAEADDEAEPGETTGGTGGGGGGGVGEEESGSGATPAGNKKVAKSDVQGLWKEIGERVKDYKQFIVDCGPAMFELKRALANNPAFASFCANNEGIAKVQLRSFSTPIGFTLILDSLLVEQVMKGSNTTDLMALLLSPAQRLTQYRLALKARLFSHSLRSSSLFHSEL
jgi:hypothetical protein